MQTTAGAGHRGWLGTGLHRCLLWLYSLGQSAEADADQQESSCGVLGKVCMLNWRTQVNIYVSQNVNVACHAAWGQGSQQQVSCHGCKVKSHLAYIVHGETVALLLSKSDHTINKRHSHPGSRHTECGVQRSKRSEVRLAVAAEE